MLHVLSTRNIFTITLLSIFLNIQPINGHGTVTSPPSRVYICFLENPESPDSPACTESVNISGTQHLYDWNAVRQGDANGNHTDVVPDGQLASGGNPSLYGGLDQVRDDWITTPVESGAFTVTWTNTAPHATAYYRVYITTSDWSPDQPLSWGKLELLEETPPRLPSTFDDIDVVLPSRTGHHVIYSVWQREDSNEAFYSASDVMFGDAPVNLPAKVIVENELEVQGDLDLNSEVFINDLANGSVQNLTIDGDGRISTGTPLSPSFDSDQNITEEVILALNKFDFASFENNGELIVARKGLHFKQGAIIKEVAGHFLDNNSEGPSASLRIYRLSKTDKGGDAELLIEVNGGETSLGTYEKFSKQVPSKKGLEQINNDRFIYYVEVRYCSDCDFTEVRFVSQY